MHSSEPQSLGGHSPCPQLEPVWPGPNPNPPALPAVAVRLRDAADPVPVTCPPGIMISTAASLYCALH
eukprot:2594417-Rhodomonas_salina.2